MDSIIPYILVISKGTKEYVGECIGICGFGIRFKGLVALYKIPKVRWNVLALGLTVYTPKN